MATEYGYKLNPYRQLRKQRGIKGVRRTIRNTHVPSTINQGETITVRFPDLGILAKCLIFNDFFPFSYLQVFKMYF